MKKTFFAAIAFSLMLLIQTNIICAQAIEKGTVLIDTYYGTPNIFLLVKDRNNGSYRGLQNIQYKSIGSFGGRFEYLMTDNVGIGLDVNYFSTYFRFDWETLDENSEPVLSTYYYDVKRTGFIATYNYHFIKQDNADFYFGFGAGYAKSTVYTDFIDINIIPLFKWLYSITGKTSIGMRYFFPNNLGLNLALGYGQGGSINGGLSYKL